MTKLHFGLAGLLIVQILIAGGLYWHDEQSRAQVNSQPLIAFDKNAVDKLVITDGSKTTTLQKVAGEWRLPEVHNLPVAHAKITEQLNKLQAARVRWPVATTNSSRERFDVADEKFQRRLQVFAGDKKIGEVLLGTSPGFRKIHARRAGEDEIYYVELNSYELPAITTEWLDKSLIAARDPEQIQGPDYELKKTGDQWMFANQISEDAAGSDTSLKVDDQKARELVTALSNLRITDVAEAAPAAEPVVITVQNSAHKWRYEFSKAKDKYYVKRNDQAQVFTLSQYDYDRIAQIRQPQLAAKSEDQESKNEDKTNS